MDTRYTKKLTTYEELDTILPMIEKFHETQAFRRFFPYSGHLLWLTVNFPCLGIWAGYERTKQGDLPLGYVIVAVQYQECRKEALIYEAYSEAKDLGLSRVVFDEIEKWAKEQGCTLLSAFTAHGKVADFISRQYGFTEQRTYFTKLL